MDELTAIKTEVPDQLSEILLVLNKDKKKIEAVKSIDKNGNMETVDPTKKNQDQFMRVDKSGDFLSNFFSNFFRQLKNPTRFSFFKVPAPTAVDTARAMQKQVNNPTVQGEQLMKKHEVLIEPLEQQKEQADQPNIPTTQSIPETNEYRYNAEQIDWQTMNNLGLSKDKLEKLNLLDPLLKGQKTNDLVAVSINLGTAVTRLDARLSLQQGDNGQVVVAIHGIRKEPNLNVEFFGHSFSEQDKENLLQTGNMGRVVALTHPKTGELVNSIISVDRLTNELIALRQDRIKIPDEIKGVKLNQTQKQILSQGEPLHLTGMLSKKGIAFDANIQFNADKRYVEFLFDRNNSTQQVQQVPNTFRGKELDKQQYDKFKNGQTVYLTGLVDKKGKEYNGYITLNKEKGKTDFSFQNPNTLQEQAKKSHRALPIKVLLKSGQKIPDAKKQKSKTAFKSKGIKL